MNATMTIDGIPARQIAQSLFRSGLAAVRPPDQQQSNILRLSDGQEKESVRRQKLYALFNPPTDPREFRKWQQRMLIARLRAERRGLDTSQYPPRLRRPRAVSRGAELRRERQKLLRGLAEIEAKLGGEA